MYTSGYRKLLKSACVLFKQDDYALNNFKKVLREEFVKNKMVVDPLLLVQCSKDIEEADELLRFRLVQGKKNERGNFCKYVIITVTNTI